VQGMLDFDFICKRKQPSVAGIIYTFGGQFVSKMCVPSFPLQTAQEHG
jgi:ATP citrate (pro-S)-lyase